MKHPIAKLALAAVLAVAAVIGIYTVGGSRPAFADVVKPILSARTAVYTVIASQPNKPVFRIQSEFMEPGRTRCTWGAEEGADKVMIQITDYVQGKSLMLVPSQNTAVIAELRGAPDRWDPRAVNMFAELRRRILLASARGDESVAYVGESEIGGRRVFGYRFAEDGMRTTLWADATSFLPLQIDYVPAEEPLDRPVEVVMTDIRFDVLLDPAAFSLKVPPGYHEQNVQVDASPVTEADVVILLRFSAEVTNGRFPSALDMTALKGLTQALRKGAAKEEPNLAEPAGQQQLQSLVQDMMKITRGLKFVMTLPPDADWHYAGAEATFGDATKPIFWYRPQGSATYRVIYADLSIRDVAPPNLLR